VQSYRHNAAKQPWCTPLRATLYRCSVVILVGPRSESGVVAYSRARKVSSMALMIGSTTPDVEVGIIEGRIEFHESPSPSPISCAADKRAWRKGSVAGMRA